MLSGNAGRACCWVSGSGLRIDQEGRCKATLKREFKLPWREAGPPDHLDDKVDSDQQVVNKELSLSREASLTSVLRE